MYIYHIHHFSFYIYIHILLYIYIYIVGYSPPHPAWPNSKNMASHLKLGIRMKIRIFHYPAWDKDEKSDTYRGDARVFFCYGFTPNLYIEESYSGAGTGVGGKGREEAKRAGQGARAGRGNGPG